MTGPQRWEPEWQPDLQMIPAVRASPRAWTGMLKLGETDRAWLVAGLSVAGMTAERIAERLDCSVRLVKAIRAWPLTEMAAAAWTMSAVLDGELHAERAEHAHTRQKLAEASRSLERLRMQMDQLLAAHLTGRIESFRCGCPKVPYNTYRHGGKAYCRKCRTDRKRKPVTCGTVNC